jgi:hypothetical protein
MDESKKKDGKCDTLLFLFFNITPVSQKLFRVYW